MGRGYAEGPALEERLAALEAREVNVVAKRRDRLAVYGATKDNPESHFIGWRDEVDPDELFATGRAWGLTIVRRRD